MGWPRKNDVCRLYQEKTDKSYILVITENERNPDGSWQCVANVISSPHPRLGSTSCTDEYLYKKCRRVQWSELPIEWHQAFMPIFQEWKMQPHEIIGLWRIESLRASRR